jgi:hypothetical protein
MPSPFPGVDPYLESQRWVSFHGQLCSEIARQLAPVLGERYVALMEERLTLESFEDVAVAIRDVRPDVVVAGHKRAAHSNLTVLEPPLRLAAPLETEVPIHFVEVREVGSMTVVTVIEVMSPSNKTGEGREDYRRKRRAILNSDVNLIEIDLLRGGFRVPMRDELPESPYFVLIHRTAQRPMADVWPIGIREALPVIPIPLLPPDKDAELDLQMVFNGAYDSIGYGRAIDYRKPVAPPLSDEDAEWARLIASPNA